MSLTFKNTNMITSITRQNINSIDMVYEYLEKIFVSFQSLYDEFKRFQDELYSFQNDLNFRPVTEQLFVTYNRLIIFLYDRVRGILSSTFTTYDSNEIQIIKPVKNKKFYYNLEITYNTSYDFDTIVTRPLGSIGTASINKINDEIIFLHTDNIFVFLLFSNFKHDGEFLLSNEEFRNHITKCCDLTKTIMGWIYSDIQNIKLMIRSLIDIVEELVKMSPSKCISEWIELLEKIKMQIATINKINK